MTDARFPSPNAAGLIALSGGVLACLLAVWMGDVDTPWGSRWYYLVGLPLMCVVAGWVSYQVPQQPGRWTVYLCLGQLLVAGVTAGIAEMLVGVIFLMALSLPIFMTAVWLSRLALRRRISSSDDTPS